MSAIGLNIKIPKQSLIRLRQLDNQQIVVKFNGGREVCGRLKSWDKSMNLILDQAVQSLQIVSGDGGKVQTAQRKLGFIIVKGSQIQSVLLQDGYTVIDNPFENNDADGDSDGDADGEVEQKSEKQKEQEQQDGDDKQ